MSEPIITPIHDRTRTDDPVVAIVQYRDVSLEDVRAYRKQHGCSLGEAVRATGWRGNRTVRLSELGPNGEIPQ